MTTSWVTSLPNPQQGGNEVKQTGVMKNKTIKELQALGLSS